MITDATGPRLPPPKIAMNKAKHQGIYFRGIRQGMKQNLEGYSGF